MEYARNPPRVPPPHPPTPQSHQLLRPGRSGGAAAEERASVRGAFPQDTAEETRELRGKRSRGEPPVIAGAPGSARVGVGVGLGRRLRRLTGGARSRSPAARRRGCAARGAGARVDGVNAGLLQLQAWFHPPLLPLLLLLLCLTSRGHPSGPLPPARATPLPCLFGAGNAKNASDLTDEG